MKFFLFILLSIFYSVQIELLAQNSIVSPDDFLGYSLGTKFTPNARVMDYFQMLSENSDKAHLYTYGDTYEDRPLVYLAISSSENLENIEEIRNNNLMKTGLSEGKPVQNGKIIAWFSYNVHGSEASSTEAAILTAYTLISQFDRYADWLENIILIIDPCVNPDGRDRYINWFNQYESVNLITDIKSVEHREPWPGGRMNHYLFDLNRDWAWASQKETRQRLAAYHSWMPQIHVDFHEQGINRPYYFAPASQPYHQLITKWQVDFQKEIGKNHAKYFDKLNWLYFSKEDFDLFYPGYGDTYPIYCGAIGMTYEQGGGGIAGLGVVLENKDTLFLRDRIDHHFTTGISTLETISKNTNRLESEFIDFFKQGMNSTSWEYNTYVISQINGKEKMAQLTRLLDRHHIWYGQIKSNREIKCFDYHSDMNRTLSIGKDDLVIPAQQPNAVLLQVLFQPHAVLVDSLTYDITSWSIPYSFDLVTYATNQVIQLDSKGYQLQASKIIGANAYAYAIKRNSIADIQVLSALLKANIQVRTNPVEIKNSDNTLPRGCFIITQADNKHYIGDIHTLLIALSEKYGVEIETLETGYSETGADIGSSRLDLLKPLQVGMLFGQSVSPYNAGEIWHFFEEEIEYPLLRIDTRYFKLINLDELDVLIIPEGKRNYRDVFSGEVIQQISDWTSDGGRLILIGNALENFVNNELFQLKSYLDETEKSTLELMKKDDNYFLKYEDRERSQVSEWINGGIYKVRFDNTHPLGYGFSDYYFTLKNDNTRYALLEKGWNVGSIQGNENKISGFAGKDSNPNTYKSLVFGVEEHGKGEVVYLVDNPLFRSFWYGGKLLFSNAVFMP